jgi:hypothetical protein
VLGLTGLGVGTEVEIVGKIVVSRLLNQGERGEDWEDGKYKNRVSIAHPTIDYRVSYLTLEECPNFCARHIVQYIERDHHLTDSSPTNLPLNNVNPSL